MMTVTNPEGKVVLDETIAGSAKVAVNDVKVGPEVFQGKRFNVDGTLKGEWSIKLSRKQTRGDIKIGRDKAPKVLGYLLHKGNADLQAYSYLDNNFTVQNNDINLVATIKDTSFERGNRELMVSKKPLTGALDSAVATIKSPSGKIHRLVLNDEGINGDKVAGDGLYSAKAPTSELGVYTSQVQIKGTNGAGKVFTRTTTDLYPVAEKTFELGNQPAELISLQGTSAKLSVAVKPLADAERVHMSAEIWGFDGEGNARAATWVGGIVEPQAKGDDTRLELGFDTRWLTNQKLQGPYTIKSLRLQNADNNVPLLVKDNLMVRSKLKPTQLTLSKSLTAAAPAQDMLMQKAPGMGKQVEAVVNNATGGKLLLVHGYCSGQAWYANEWTNAVEFKDYKQNISHDTFAKRVRDFGAQYPSFGVVAHSQGGAAALTLYTRYYSGLDNAGSGRLIQSVGTPYQGTALAGNLAAIGDVFGAGCGKNTDLTYSGASNWLATIPSWARAKVDYYTTSFNTRWWAYDYCHLATDLFLDDPEDGTTEQWSGQLSGANNKGHKKGWCHTSGMRDPGQTRDGSRNSYMNGAAAR